MSIAMKLFPNGGFVRLRSRVRADRYLHADEDGDGISLRPLGGTGSASAAASSSSINAVWRVQHWRAEGGATYLVLQSAAYGRYLGTSVDHPPPGHRGRCAVQRDFDEPGLVHTFMWTPTMVHQHYGRGGGYVLLANDFMFCLRANGRHRRWLNGVTVDLGCGCFGATTMMHWKVEAVPLVSVPLPLPPPPQDPIHVRRGMFWRRTGHEVHPHQRRTIRHVRADDEGNFNPNHLTWRAFNFDGHSVFNLRTQVAHHQGGDIDDITLCVQPGLLGKLTPLVTNLPRSQDPMNIVVLTNGSPAAQRLVYPNV